MTILHEANQAILEEQQEIEEEMEFIPPEEPKARFSDMLPDLSILAAKTGDGSIESYLDHPLNAKKSRGMAQMLRGFTGIAGSLDYAIIDIVIGAFNYNREGKIPNASEPTE